MITPKVNGGEICWIQCATVRTSKLFSSLYQLEKHTPPPPHTHNPTCPSIQSEDTSVYGVWKKLHKYIKARAILALRHTKWGFFFDKHMPNKARIWFRPHYTPIGRIHEVAIRTPQSDDSNFNLTLSKCAHFKSVILHLDLALNASTNTSHTPTHPHTPHTQEKFGIACNVK